MADRFEQEIDELYQKWISSPSAVVGARLADRLRSTGRLDEAAEIAGRGLEEWPTNLSLKVVLGRCHLDKGNLVEAGKAFAEVRSRDPLNLVALRSLATIAFKMESWDKAIELTEEYLFENPTDEEAEQMLEQAKLARKEQPSPPVPQAEAPAEDEVAPEAVEEAEEAASAEEQAPEEFPDTRRMEKILAGQMGEEGEAGVPENAENTQESDPPQSAETAGMRREPRSLMDLFSSEEKEDLNLKPFEAGG